MSRSTPPETWDSVSGIQAWVEKIIPLELYRNMKDEGEYQFRAGNHFFKDQAKMAVIFQTPEKNGRWSRQTKLSLDLLTYRLPLQIKHVTTSWLDISAFTYDWNKVVSFNPPLRLGSWWTVITDSTSIVIQAISMDSYDTFIWTLTEILVRLKTIFPTLEERRDTQVGWLIQSSRNQTQWVLDSGSIDIETIRIIPDGTISLEDVGLSQYNEQEIRAFLSLLRSDKEELSNRWVNIPRWYLLQWPPWVGKTEIMRWMSNNDDVLVYKIDKTDYDNPLKWVWPQRLSAYLQAILTEAKQKRKHAIILLDEADGILLKKWNSHPADNDCLNVLLKFMDGIGTADIPVTIFVGTNIEKWQMEKSALRPGKIGRHLVVRYPWKNVRRKIFLSHMERKFSSSGNSHLFDGYIDIEQLVSLTSWLNGADIKEIFDLACQKAYLRGFDSWVSHSLNILWEFLEKRWVRTVHHSLGENDIPVVMWDLLESVRIIKERK